MGDNSLKQPGGGIEAGGEQPVQQPEKLKQMEEKEHVEKLVHGNQFEQAAAARGLTQLIKAGKIGDPSNLEPMLRVLLEHNYPTARENAAEALQEIENLAHGNQSEKDLEEQKYKVLEAVHETLSQALEKEGVLEAEFEKVVEAKIAEIVQKIESMKDKLQQRGVDIGKLEAELQEIKKDGKAKIIGHCLVAYSPGSPRVAGKSHEDQIDFWANYFTLSEFKHLAGDDLRKAYSSVFPEVSGGEPRKVDEDTWSRPIDPKDTTSAREIMRHALASPKLNNLSELVGTGERIFDTEAGKEAFNKKITELLDVFTTHGMLGKPDPKTGERPLLPKSDLDGQACIILLKKVGFDLSKIKYVRQGEEPESGWVFDTGKEHGYVAKDGGKILITNDSNKESGNDSSAKFIFDGLVKFGLLDTKKHPGIRKFVEFVTKEDNKDYTDEQAKQIIAHYSKNLMGLRRFLTDEALVRIFEEQTMESSDFSPYRELPVSYLEKLSYIDGLSFKDVIKKLTDSKKYSLKAIENLAEQGFAVDTGEHFGRVLIDTGQKNAQGARGRKVGLGFDAARHEGYGAYVVFDEEGKYFSVQTVKEMNFNFSQGFAVGKRYWLFTGKDVEGKDEKLTTSLEEILKKLNGNPNYQMETGLKEALEKERKENEEVEKRIDSLSRGLKIDEIEQGIPEDVSSLPDDEKKKVEEKIKTLWEAKVLIRKMAGAYSSEDLTFFLESIFEEKYLEYYKKTRDQEADPAKPQIFEDKFKKNLRDYLEENGYNKNETKQILNLFGKINELKFG